MPLNKNSVLKQFRQAAKSCNEWRDTLFYTGLFATSLATAKWNFVPQDMVIYAGALREGLRACRWSSLAGTFPTNEQHTAAAIFVGLSFSALTIITRGIQHHDPMGAVTENPFFFAGALFLTAYDYNRAGGIKKMFAAYKETMFDYPRKILPPREPRKNSTLANLKGLLEKLGGWVPQPSPVRALTSQISTLPHSNNFNIP